MRKRILKLVIMALIPVFGCCNEPTVRKMYVGGYTGRDVVNGVHIIDVDFKNGTFTHLAEIDAGPSPSYICISDKFGMVYAGNEAAREVDGVRMGSVTALKLNADGSNAEKAKEIFIHIGGPCHLSLTPEEDFLLLAHYGAGGISVIRLDGNGIPTEVTDTIIFREEGIRSARGHMAATSPDGKKVYLSCLSLDKIMIFDLDKTTGKLTQTGAGILPEGSGPRHYTFNHDGSKMYVINELALTMTVFNVGSNGSLTEIQTISTLPQGESRAEGQSTADVHLSKCGNYLYGSNRGHNTIVTFKVAGDGRLSLVGHTTSGGNHPRNFTLDPSGKYLLVANTNAGRPIPDLQNPENITLFTIDKKTGLPIAPGITYVTRQPSCLKFIE